MVGRDFRFVPPQTFHEDAQCLRPGRPSFISGLLFDSSHPGLAVILTYEPASGQANRAAGHHPRCINI